jgi:hypothetical protein
VWTSTSVVMGLADRAGPVHRRYEMRMRAVRAARFPFRAASTAPLAQVEIGRSVTEGHAVFPVRLISERDYRDPAHDPSMGNIVSATPDDCKHDREANLFQPPLPQVFPPRLSRPIPAVELVSASRTSGSTGGAASSTTSGRALPPYRPGIYAALFRGP